MREVQEQLETSSLQMMARIPVPSATMLIKERESISTSEQPAVPARCGEASTTARPSCCGSLEDSLLTMELMSCRRLAARSRRLCVPNFVSCHPSHQATSPSQHRLHVFSIPS